MTVDLAATPTLPAPLSRRLALRVAGLADTVPRGRFARAAALTIGLAVLLVLPSVGTGYAADDLILEVALDGSSPLARAIPNRPHDLFAFISGEPASHRVALDRGMVPWWTPPSLRISFFRPLASLTHQLDHRVAPGAPVVAHLHNLLWFALALLAVAWLYRSLLGATGVALLATLLYALDDAHGQPVGWISARNACMALAFGIAAVLAYDRYRRARWLPGALLSPVLLLLALLSGEAGIGAVAYLGAYALCLDEGKLPSRLLRLVPAALTVIAWRGLGSALGHAVQHSGLYIDPVHSPLRFLVAAAERIPILLLAQLAFPPADTALVYAYVHPWLGPAVAAASALLLVGFVLACAPLLREDPRARFFATGALLAVVPCCAGVPQDRMLWFVGVGAMGSLALFVVRVADRLAEAGASRWERWGLAPLALALALLHLAVAPPLLAVRSQAMGRFAASLERAPRALDGIPDLEAKTVVFLNPPVDMPLVYSFASRTVAGEPLPAALRWLVATEQEIAIERVDARTLEVRVDEGFLRHAPHHFFFDPAEGMEPGQAYATAGMTATVLETTPDRLPRAVRFDFDASLDDPRFVYRAWTADGFVPFVLPAVGERVVLAGTDPRLALAAPSTAGRVRHPR